MRRIVILLLAVSPGGAQIRNMATLGDGAELYFSTPLPRRDTDEPTQERIYKIGAKGLELVNCGTDSTLFAPESMSY